MSYDNTVDLGADTWRHVAFVEQRGRWARRRRASLAEAAERPAGRPETHQDADGLRWLMASDVCKHCTHAACLDVCPTGALFRTEFGTVVVQQDVCNGCGYCVPACPFGVIDRREDDGRAWKCTLCYDRLKDDLSPRARRPARPSRSSSASSTSCASAREERLEQLHGGRRGRGAQLYGADRDDGVGGFGAFFLLLDEPEVYGLPPGPGRRHARPRRDVGGRGTRRGGAGRRRGRGGARRPAVSGGERERRWCRGPSRAPTTAGRSSSRRSGRGRSRSTSSSAAWPAPRPALARAGRAARRAASWPGARWRVALAGAVVSPALLISDLGRPERFLNMLRVFKVTSPMSVGSWVLAAFGAAASAGAADHAARRLVPGGVRARHGRGRVLGLPLATYTAALVANTAVPVVARGAPHAAVRVRRGAAASAGARCRASRPSARAGPARRLAIGGRGGRARGGDG